MQLKGRVTKISNDEDYGKRLSLFLFSVDQQLTLTLPNFDDYKVGDFLLLDVTKDDSY